MAKSFTWTEKSVRWILAKIKEIRKEKNVVLPLSGWVNGRQTVAVDGVTANSSIIVAGSADSAPEYDDCGVYCCGQGAGTLTFEAYWKPDTNLTADVLVLN